MTARSGLPRGLLVSVRSVEEAVEAAAGGAAIVDVKEPARGPLGRADAAVAAAIVAAVASRPCTLACGELAEGAEAIAAHVAAVVAAAAGRRPAGAKAGPGGLDLGLWRQEFARFVRALPPDVEPVAVAYADPRAAGAPDPEAIIDAAATLGAATILFDTFDKSGPPLLVAAGRDRVARWVERSHRAGLSVAVAGRLASSDMATIVGLGPEIVGVRSAACGGGRLGRVDRGNVARIAGTLGFGRAEPAIVIGRVAT